MTNTQDTWPAGATYVFQGTVAEDATAGTHVSTCTITPGTGNEMEVLYGAIIVGNTATAQSPKVRITDGTNTITILLNPSGNTGTTASLAYPFPVSTGGALASAPAQYAPHMVSGTQQLILQVDTAAVSVTQTFSVACRIHGAKPTAVLNDTIGTSTNTVNTDAVF